jgi:hypothetical protein
LPEEFALGAPAQEHWEHIEAIEPFHLGIGGGGLATSGNSKLCIFLRAEDLFEYEEGHKRREKKI